MRAVPFLAGGFEEAQWWAGQLDRSEHRMLDVDQQALRAGLIPVVDLLQVLDLATGHADGKGMSKAGANRDHRPSEPTAIWTIPSAEWNRP